MTKKLKTGRPESPYPRRYALRHTDAQMDLTLRKGTWLVAAARAGMEVGDWIRATLDKAAGR